MSLADEVMAALPGLRTEAESLMLDRGVMRRRTGYSEQDANGEELPTYVDLFTAPCKVQAASGKDAVTRTVVIGGVERPVVTEGLHIPVGSPATQNGDVFEVTQVGSLSDIRLLGKRYMVDNDPVKSNATARRIDVVEV